MKNLKNIEIIALNTLDGQLIALVSYQNPEKEDLNNGYDTISIPVNLRRLQLSPRGGMLVDQSVKEESIAVNKVE